MAATGPERDQIPENWSVGAQGYEQAFAGFTGMYADEMLDRLGVTTGSRMLDVAAGTGAASVRAAERGADVLATDFAPGMVEVVSRRLRDGGHGTARTEVMDGQALGVPDDAFDAAVSMFGLMFFPDVDAGLAEMRRAVRPGGAVGTATWDLDGFPMHRLIGEALRRSLPGYEAGPPPLPTWAPLGNQGGLEEFLRRGGLDDVRVTQATRQWRFADPAGFFRDLPTWSPPVQPLFDALPEEAVGDAATAFAEVVAEAGGADGGPGIPMEALLGTGTVPNR
jgi:SAM-dependent methyltransferase